jgi:hypothetical protein
MGPWGLLNLRRVLRCVSLCGRGAALALLREGEAYGRFLERAGQLDLLPPLKQWHANRVEVSANPKPSPNTNRADIAAPATLLHDGNGKASSLMTSAAGSVSCVHVVAHAGMRSSSGCGDATMLLE